MTLAFAAAVGGSPASAQASGDALARVIEYRLASREQLIARLDSLDRATANESRPGGRSRLEAETAVLRLRIEKGDIAVGDRLLVRRVADSVRTDTVLVSPSGSITLPGLPPLQVRPALYGEVEGRIQGEVERYVRGVRVTVQPLLAVGVLGAVTRPGYFLIPAASNVADALMVAGGPVSDANPTGVRLRRGGRDRWPRATMTAAMQAQLSLAALGAESGDELVVERSPAPLDRAFLFAAAGLLVQVLLTISIIGGS